MRHSGRVVAGLVLVAGLLAVSADGGPAQDLTLDWRYEHPATPESDSFVGLDADAAGNVAFLAARTRGPALRWNAVSVRADGTLRWAREYVPTPVSEDPAGVALAADGSCYLVGTQPQPGAEPRALVVGLRPDGTVQWETVVDGIADANGILSLGAGGCVVFGKSASRILSWAASLIDPQGAVLDTGVRFKTRAEFPLDGATVDAAGDAWFAAAGPKTLDVPGAAEGGRLQVYRYTPGTKLVEFANHFDGEIDFFPRGALGLGEGGAVFAAAEGERLADTAEGIVTVKFDADGELAWAAFFEAPREGLTEGARPRAVLSDGAGGVYVGGEVDRLLPERKRSSVSRSVPTVFHYDASGALVATLTVSTVGLEGGTCFALLPGPSGRPLAAAALDGEVFLLAEIAADDTLGNIVLTPDIDAARAAGTSAGAVLIGGHEHVGVTTILEPKIQRFSAGVRSFGGKRKPRGKRVRVKFRKTASGRFTRRAVRLRNRSDDWMRVDVPALAAPFLGGASTTFVPPRGQVFVQLAFGPERPGKFDESVEVATSDPDRPTFDLRLRGKAK